MAILQIITVYTLYIISLSFLVPDLERHEHFVHVFIYYRSFNFLLDTTKTKIHISMPIKTVYIPCLFLSSLSSTSRELRYTIVYVKNCSESILSPF